MVREMRWIAQEIRNNQSGRISILSPQRRGDRRLCKDRVT
jgi:hypothetical protein